MLIELINQLSIVLLVLHYSLLFLFLLLLVFLFYLVSFRSDLVHRQTACWTVKHMALGVFGFGCEDALTHLMNLVWPNIFETSPHMVQSFNDAADGLRVSVGPMKVFHYTVQVFVCLCGRYLCSKCLCVCVCVLCVYVHFCIHVHSC